MEFNQLTPDRYQSLKPFFENQPYDLCVYNLPSLIVWTNSVSKHYAGIKDDLLVLYIDYPKVVDIPAHLILPVSREGELRLHPKDLFDLTVSLGFRSCQYVPEAYIKNNDQKIIESYFKIEEQPEYSDYVYKTKDLGYLEGNKYSKKRNLIHQFLNEYEEKNRIKIEPISSGKTVDSCLKFLEEWCKQRDCEEDKDISLACEREAVIKALENFENLEFNGICLKIDETVCALGISSRLNRQMGVLHFEKAFTHIKGLYQYFDSECAKSLFNNYEYINKESDMGIPGIAKAKNSYHPTKMVKSFKLTIK